MNNIFNFEDFKLNEFMDFTTIDYEILRKYDNVYSILYNEEIYYFSFDLYEISQLLDDQNLTAIKIDFGIEKDGKISSTLTNNFEYLAIYNIISDLLCDFLSTIKEVDTINSFLISVITNVEKRLSVYSKLLNKLIGFSDREIIKTIDITKEYKKMNYFTDTKLHNLKMSKKHKKLTANLYTFDDIEIDEFCRNLKESKFKNKFI